MGSSRENFEALVEENTRLQQENARLVKAHETVLQVSDKNRTRAIVAEDDLHYRDKKLMEETLLVEKLLEENARLKRELEECRRELASYLDHEEFDEDLHCTGDCGDGDDRCFGCDLEEGEQE